MDYTRDLKCNKSQGGAGKLYVLPYTNIFDSSITIEDSILVQFPYSGIFDLNATNINYSIDIKEDVDILHDIKVSFQLKQLNETDFFRDFITKDFRIIIQDNNGKFRFLGLYNGLKGSIQEQIGTNRNEFNGYAFTFEGKEEINAPYLLDLDDFSIGGIIALQYELQFNL